MSTKEYETVLTKDFKQVAIPHEIFKKCGAAIVDELLEILGFDVRSDSVIMNSHYPGQLASENTTPLSVVNDKERGLRIYSQGKGIETSSLTLANGSKITTKNSIGSGDFSFNQRLTNIAMKALHKDLILVEVSSRGDHIVLYEDKAVIDIYFLEPISIDELEDVVLQNIFLKHSLNSDFVEIGWVNIRRTQ